MNAAGQTLCLNMIVKNEAPVIRRCIDSVRPIIDRWVIVDTGSTDGTQDIIREHLRGLPGELHERPWRDFAHNRSEALELARGKSDYTLIIDADDALEIAPGTVVPSLVADAYMIEIDDISMVYQRMQVVRCAMPWRYRGVLHEYLTCEEAGPSEELPGIRMRRNHDGARRRDPDTYRRDAVVLERALQTETDPFLLARYQFYLAQSYRDCGEWERALEHYLARARLGFWKDEVFVSLYHAAQLKERLRHPDQEVVDAYLGAADTLSTRAEALHGVSRFYRRKGRYAEGYQSAKRGLAIPMPSSAALFVEPWIYEIGLLDELSLNAYWSGHNRESLDASLKILGSGKLPAADLPRVAANARFASERLPREPDLGSRGIEGFVEQHTLGASRPLRSRLSGSPRVLVTILANRQKELLPLYLRCIEALDYPKASIVLCIRGDDNAGATKPLLREWIDRVGALYAAVKLGAEDGQCRAVDHGCDFCFVTDVNHFVRPCTLRELVALNLPIVAPFLRSIAPGDLYSNYHAEIDGNGYFKPCDQYAWVLNRWVRGVLEMPVVNGTYLVRADILNGLAYQDGTHRDEYVVFSESARKQNIQQYLDNRQIYGYIATGEANHQSISKDIERVEELLEEAVSY
jgi:glycosyltransferase involved in cell wall biosynthesis